MINNYPKISRIFFATVCLTIILGSSAVAQKFGKISDEEWALQPPVNYPETDAVIIFNNGDMEITYEPFRIKMVRHVRIKIFNKDGAEDAMTVEIPHRKGDNIKGLKAHTISPGGKKKKVKDIFKKKSGGTITITFTFPAVEDGSILEYRYRQTHQRFNYLDPWYFQGDVYTLASRFSVALYPGFTYNAAGRSLSAMDKKPREEEYNFMGVPGVKYIWEIKDILSAKREPLMGSQNDLRASLQFQLVSFRSTYSSYSFNRSWSKIGDMYQDWFYEYVPRGTEDEIDKILARFDGDSLSEAENIRDIYNFVRDEIETRDTQEGDGNIKKTLERKYGTDTEKNILLVEMLRRGGHPAHLLRIGTRGYHSAFNPRAKQLSQFNSVICYIENDSGGLVLDTSEETTFFPYLPSYDLVEGGLLIDGEDSRPIKLNHPKRKSGQKAVSKIYVRSDGSAICSTTVCLCGYIIDNYGRAISGSLTPREMVEQFMGEESGEYDIVSASSEHDINGDSLWFDMVLELPKFAEVMDGNLLFSPFVIPIGTNPFISKRRYYPIDFRFIQSDSHRIQVCIPEGMQYSDLPTDIRQTIPGGLFSRRIVQDANMLYVQTSLMIEKPIFGSGEYSGLKGLFESMVLSGTDQVAVSPSEVPAGIE